MKMEKQLYSDLLRNIFGISMDKCTSSEWSIEYKSTVRSEKMVFCHKEDILLTHSSCCKRNQFLAARLYASSFDRFDEI